MDNCSCNNTGCLNSPNLRCKRCRILCFPASIGRYCSRDCQHQHNPIHKKIHRACRSNKSKRRTFPDGMSETVALTLLDLKYGTNRLPEISTTGDFSVLFAGASDEIEAGLDFEHLFIVIWFCSVFPNFNKLEIWLIGPNITFRPQYSVLGGRVIINTVKNTVEKVFDVMNISVQLIYLVTPGFTSFLDKWTPAINLITSKNIVTISTMYSDNDNRNNDALFDENILKEYFRANIIIQTTSNPRYFKVFSKLGFKNACYCVFQGLNHTMPVTPRLVYLKRLTSLYLRFQADYYYQDNEQFSRNCLTIANDLESGARVYQDQSLSYYIHLANCDSV